MLRQLLPAQFDNHYAGYRLALPVFAVLVALKTLIGVNCILHGYHVATAADGLPLDAYTPACADTVVSDFASWGLAQLMLCSICWLALARYRSMTPLLYLLLLVEHLGRQLIHHFLPVAKVGSPPGHLVNLILLMLMIVGLALALVSRDTRGPRGPAGDGQP
jgi:hypothetical protein